MSEKILKEFLMAPIKLRQALIAGSSWDLLSAPIELLKNAGFEIDIAIIAANKHLLRNRSLTRETILATNLKEMPYLISRLYENRRYDLVVVGDDDTLKEILNSKLSDEKKLDILPVASRKDFTHLYSKIGLSHTLKQNNILTPAFKAINDVDCLINSANEFGFPLLLKIDSSNGGVGVFECQSRVNIFTIIDKLTFPLLMQRKIDGEIIDLSGFFQNNELIFFNYSKFEKVVWNKLGPSVLREFTQISLMPQEIVNDLRSLGRALGANGFVSITCIKSYADGRLYYFEADMRPNAWIGYGKFIGSDDSTKIRNYFASKKILTNPPIFNQNFPKKLHIPLISKLKAWELLVNRHNAWFYPDGEQSALDYLILSWKKQLIKIISCSSSKYKKIAQKYTSIIHSIKNRVIYSIEVFAIKMIKPYLPSKVLHSLRISYKKLRAIK